ncbi:hypothetical protein H8788_05270 [Parabacteroides faecis]|uniref:GapS4a family protein n=1 Tax=Parabacteroides TaxID=375288 RepID=UPI000EFDEACC|nr:MULTISPECIES: hypothetical protein [Parabacteroides]MBC8617139.1 hypothetical protein [Parabacteroides faecis]RHS01090.1 hypothetical protein DWW23_01065 [Parabacteroides sp. AF14-59]
MGEWSKKIGEYGEDIVEKFLSIIGWNDPAKGVVIPCMKTNNEHLNGKGKTCETHGIDFLYSYSNPLVDNQINNVVISVKYKTEKYPNSPTKLFKGFVEDLIMQLECFDYSETKERLLDGRMCNSINDIGVLFWLNNKAESNDDLISIISSSRIDRYANKTIYIMDNKRVAFILEIMKYIKVQNHQYDYSFYYPCTGQNINPINRTNTGKILPVEYLNSSIIPIKLENKDNHKEICLFIGVLDNFDEDDFTRLMGLAKDISTSLAGQVIIAFPDYSELEHGEAVAIAKQKFQEAEYTKTVKVINFNNPLAFF